MSKLSHSMSTRSSATCDSASSSLSSSSSSPSLASNDTKKSRRSSDSPRHVGPLPHQHLYRDVLHSIMVFLPLRDVSVMARTHKQWLADVPLMPVRIDYGHARIKTIDALHEALTSRFSNHVTHVHLNCGQINASHISELVRVVRTNRSIARLDIRYQSGHRDESAVIELVVAILLHTTTLRDLRLLSPIGTEGMIVVADALTHNSTLRELRLPSAVGPEGAIAVAEALVHNTTLTTLSMRYIDFSDSNDAERLGSVLTKNRALRSLDLRHICLNTAAVAMAGLIRDHPTLTAINLSGYHHIQSTGAMALVEGIRDNRSRALRIVNLDGVALGKPHVDVLADVIRDPTRVLASINLSGTGLDDACANVLVDALRVNRTVTDVDVSSNQDMSDAAGMALAEMLGTNTVITILDVSNLLGTGERTATAFVHVTAQTKTLKWLNLSDNRAIDDSMAVQFADALATNQSLVELDLFSTQIGVSAVHALEAMLAVNQTLTRLDLRCNERLFDSVPSLTSERAKRVILLRDSSI